MMRFRRIGDPGTASAFNHHIPSPYHHYLASKLHLLGSSSNDLLYVVIQYWSRRPSTRVLAPRSLTDSLQLIISTT